MTIVEKEKYRNQANKINAAPRKRRRMVLKAFVSTDSEDRY